MGAHVRKALDTSDIREARKRRWDALEWAKGRFREEEAKAAGGKPKVLHPDELSYAAFRAKLAREIGPATVINALDGEEMTNPSLDQLADALRESGTLRKHPEVGEALADHVSGHTRVSDLLKDYLASNAKRSPKTAMNYRTTVDLWVKAHGDRPLRGVKTKATLEWLEGLADGKARDTLKRYATVMAHLWTWDHRKDEDPPRNPFEGLLGKMGTKGRATQSYGFYSDEELRKAFEAVKDDDNLRPVFLKSLFTGFRLDECLRAERETLGGVECFVIRGGKTENASRVVPVHPRLKDLVVPRDMKASALSVRYGRLMRDLKMPEGKTFHSLRKAFTTALERAGCPEAVAARLVGHAPLGITYRVYSQGKDAEELRGWVEKITMPI
jgi:integrase